MSTFEALLIADSVMLGLLALAVAFRWPARRHARAVAKGQRRRRRELRMLRELVMDAPPFLIDRAIADMEQHNLTSTDAAE